MSFETIHSDARAIQCPPLSQWECLSPRRVPEEMHITPRSLVKKVAVAHSSTLELTRFQRFIRRMESAGPRIVLDRLKEEWQDAQDEAVDEEVCLKEKLCIGNCGLIRHSSSLKSNSGFLRASKCRTWARLGSLQDHLVIPVEFWNCTVTSVSCVSKFNMSYSV